MGLALIEWEGIKINLLDTPGYFDFIGDVLGALRVADSVVVTVCAVSGVEVGTEKVWSYANDFKLPRVVFINKLDRENADFQRCWNSWKPTLARESFRCSCPSARKPILRGSLIYWPRKPFIFPMKERRLKKLKYRPIWASKWLSLRDKIVEAAAESDDELLKNILKERRLSRAKSCKA